VTSRKVLFCKSCSVAGRSAKSAIICSFDFFIEFGSRNILIELSLVDDNVLTGTSVFVRLTSVVVSSLIGFIINHISLMFSIILKI